MDNPLAGTWRLVSMETRDADGQVSYPYGQDAAGYAIYGPDGYVCFNIMRAGGPQDASGYFAYCGRYELVEGKVLHHIAVSLFPTLIGTTVERAIALDGDRLTLSGVPATGSGTARIDWERVRE